MQLLHLVFLFSAPSLFLCHLPSLMPSISYSFLHLFPPRLFWCLKWHVDFHVKAFLVAGLPACLASFLWPMSALPQWRSYRPPSLPLSVSVSLYFVSLTAPVSSTEVGSLTHWPGHARWETKAGRYWKGESGGVLLLFIHLASIDNRAFGSNLLVRGTTVHFCEAITRQFPWGKPIVNRLYQAI